MIQALSLVGLLAGCIHRVEITTVPAGAVLYREQRQLGDAPVTVKIPMFASTAIEARMPGFRTVQTKLRGVGTMSFVSDVLFLHWLRATGIKPKAQIEIRLIPEHGPMGSWDPDAVP